MTPPKSTQPKVSLTSPIVLHSVMVRRVTKAIEPNTIVGGVFATFIYRRQG